MQSSKIKLVMLKKNLLITACLDCIHRNEMHKQMDHTVALKMGGYIQYI